MKQSCTLDFGRYKAQLSSFWCDMLFYTLELAAYENQHYNSTFFFPAQMEIKLIIRRNRFVD